MPDVYRIGVAIGMTNNVSSALKIIQRDILGLNKTIDLTQGKFDRLKLAVMGAGSLFVGAAALTGFAKLAEAGGALLDQQQKMVSNATTQRDLALEMAAAYQMTSIAGSNLVQNLKMVADLRQVFGHQNLSDVIKLAPNLMKSGIAAGLLTGQDSENAAYQIAQIAERLGYTTNPKTGQIDPTQMAKLGNLVDAIISATNGRVGTNDLLGFSQMASAGGRVLSLQGLMDMVPIIQTFGGQKAGTMLTAFQKAFIGGVMTQRGSSWLAGLGLLSPKNIHRGESGYAQVKTSMIAGFNTMIDDPQAWANQYLMPALNKAHIGPQQMLQNLAPGLKMTSDLKGDLVKILQSGFANTNVRFLADLIANSTINAKEVGNLKAASGVNQYGAMIQSFSGGTTNFESAITGLMQALGLPAAKTSVTVLNSISGSIRNFTQWVGAHPGYAAVIDKTLLALGVGLTVLGGAAIVAGVAAMVGAGGYIALAAAGLAGLGAALAAFPNALVDAEKGVQRFLYDVTHPGQLLTDLTTPTPGYVSPHFTPRFGATPAPNGSHPLQAIKDWIDQGAPTTVTNVRDIGKSSAAIAARNIHQGLTGPSTGTSGTNLRATPSGSAAVQIHGRS